MGPTTALVYGIHVLLAYQKLLTRAYIAGRQTKAPIASEGLADGLVQTTPVFGDPKDHINARILIWYTISKTSYMV